MLFTTLPMLLIHSFITNYIYAITPSYSRVYSVADIYYGLITMGFYLFAQIPYIRFIYNEYMGIEHNLRNSFYVFIVNGFTIFIFTCIVSFFTTIGLILFVIPGIIVICLLFPIPYISTFDMKSTWKSFKEGLRLGRKKFLKLLVIILLSGVFEWIVGLAISRALFHITSSYAAQIITQMVLNLLFYPFVILYLTTSIIKWREAQDVLEVNAKGDGIYDAL